MTRHLIPGMGSTRLERLSPGLRGGPNEALLVAQDVTKIFVGSSTDKELHAAVDQVSFDVRAAETVGIVGESGSGKSTLARCLLRLIGLSGGTVYFDGQDIGGLDSRALRRLRRDAQIVFQDPHASLDPRMSVRASVEEPLVIHGIGDRHTRARRCLEVLDLVGITAAQVERKPHAFSGGQRQRVAIARALILNPLLLVLDEPVSALDVSIQAQVVNLLRSLQLELDLTYIFITHDLSLAEYFCERVCVLYRGRVMEIGSAEDIFAAPLHPYTLALFAAIPNPDPDVHVARKREWLAGEGDDVTGGGCRFRARCPVGHNRDKCRTEEPPLIEHGPGHWAACHYPVETSGTPAGVTPMNDAGDTSTGDRR